MKKIVYMDASASWLKPQSVIESEVDFLTNFYANAGRGICARAGNVDNLIAKSRNAIANFIVAEPENIVFVSGATDALNRIANIIIESGRVNMPIVAVSDLDHHSSQLPWMALAKSNRCKIVNCDLDENFNIDINKIPKCDVFVITAMSNVLGVAQDVEKIIYAARQKNPNVITIVDAAQYVVHKKIDVKKFDCDFLCFSGHKIGADTGVGVMYIRDVEKWYPDKFGGGMVNKIIDDNNWILNSGAQKFEAGTLPLTQIIGLPNAIDYVSNWDGGMDLIHYMYDELIKLPRIKMITKRDACIIDFVVDNMQPIDLGVMLGVRDICVRVGNMCASWIHKRIGIDGSIRISVGPWNTMEDAKYVVNLVRELVE